MTGQTISHYRILEKLGEGGMGVVYKAEDTKLRRVVALKFLPSTDDGAVRERFLREAQAAAALNHPNICTVHEIDQEQWFLAMEFIEGESVKDKVARRPLPLEEALDIAQQTCAGLAEAHEKGVVHRDIKSANLMLTAQGQVKIMDFGLAQIGDRTRITKTGSSMGTPAYMSPEQAKGEPADRRSDIWSLAVVVYEMLTGRLPFPGETDAAVAYAIVHTTPEPLTAVRAGLPVDLDRVISRALAKDPGERYQHVEEFASELRRLARQTTPSSPKAARNALRLAWAVAGLLFAAMAVLAVLLVRKPGAAEQGFPLRRFTIRPPAPINARLYNRAVAISPNGKHIAFFTGGSESRLWIQDLDKQNAREISDSDGAKEPFWSPDSDLVGFFLADRLMKVPANGGHPVPLCRLPEEASYGGSWGLEGIVFAAGNPSSLYTVPASGGTAKRLMSKEAVSKAVQLAGREGYFTDPHYLPKSAGADAVIFRVGYVNSSLMLYESRSGKAKFLADGMNPFYAPTGHVVYTRPGKSDLWALPFSLEKLRATGETFRIAANGMHPSVSNDGTLVYLDAPAEQLAWFSREGKRIGLAGAPSEGAFFPAISPDGRHLAYESMESANLDVWILDVARGSRTRLTSDFATDNIPSWSPDGAEVAYGSYRSGSVDIWLRRADGGTEEQMLIGTSKNERVSDWSSDGQHILYSAIDNKGASDIWYLTRTGTGKWEPRPFLQTAANERVAKLSPDGRFVAYLSDESGRQELYVRPFPRGESKWVISTKGAAQPRWSRDGKEIYFGEAGWLVAVPVSTSPTFSAGVPSRLFAQYALSRGENEPQYDVSFDRQKILLPESVGGNELLIRVVQNWFAEFRDKRK